MTTPRANVAANLLAIDSHQNAESTVLVLRGEIDLASAPQLEQALTDAARAGPPSIVIDLAHLEFIDCAGLGALIHGQEDADSNGHSLTLRHIPPQAERLFKMTGAADAFVSE